MSLESDLRAAFLANSTVGNLIGSRFFPGFAPQEAARPLVIYQQIASSGESTLSGMFVQQSARYQLRIVADTYNSIVQTKAALLLLAGTAYNSLTRIEISEGPDGFDFEDARYTKILEVNVLT